MVFEFFQAGDSPDSCLPERGPAPISQEILFNLWVNDTEIVDYIKANYDGLPVHYADIQVEDVIQDNLRDRVVRWDVDGGKQVELHTVDEDQLAMASGFVYRMVFYNQTRVGALDLDLRYGFHPPYTARLTYGTIHPPLLLADVSEDYAASGQRTEQVSASARITLFKDHQCTPA